ncbi:uncharacterized protein SPSC_01219 [Sporisorium scitamineum]|uniref:DUF1764-domain-containing protein n=1 Tax=Sporisorium scitamineum TaxID=49012 RepID=A0A127Z8X8_9BASI|nr:uncharacterized protein SPSC_01219 [Sporisorium scitamineum]
MAKSSKSAASASKPSSAMGTKTNKSEIDDIFAAPIKASGSGTSNSSKTGGSKASDKVKSPTESGSSKQSSKHKNSNSSLDHLNVPATKRKRPTQSSSTTTSTSTHTSNPPKKKPKTPVQVVQDTSSLTPHHKTTSTLLQKDDDDVQEFIDSRGTSGDRRKRTVDGLRIFTVEELRLGEQGAGETSLCPFDCDCCKCPSPSRSGAERGWGVFLWANLRFLFFFFCASFSSPIIHPPAKRRIC